MYFAVLGAGAVVALALIVWALKTAHSGPGSGRGHARNPLQRVVLGVLTLLIRTSLRMGIRFGPMMMLTVPGRTSGLPRSNPVDLWTGDGRRFLVATHTEHAAWVRNLRAARGGTLWLGRRRWSFTAIELPREDAAAVLKNVLGPRMRRPIAGFVLRRTVAVPPDAPMGAFVEAAKTHPVFEVALTPIDTPGSGSRSADARETA
jgi:deazaflavin-dependent oxidoreductase (nitroreductase family)